MQPSGRFYLGVLMFTIVASACATSYEASNKPIETVVATSDGMQVRPPWINESVPFKTEQGLITALGIAQIPTDYRLEAGFDIAKSNAQRRLSRELEERMAVMSDNSDVADQAGYIGDKAVTSLSSSLSQGPTYWEKIAIQSANGNSEVYRMYTTVSVSEDAYKKAIKTAADDTEKKNINEMSPELPKVLTDQWARLVGPASDIRAVPELQPPERGPVAASETSLESEQRLKDHLKMADVVLTGAGTGTATGTRSPASMPEAVIVEGKYTVQVSAFLEEPRAQDLVTKLKGQGLDAYYVPAQVNGQQFYRVSVGQFKSRGAAVRYAKKTDLKDYAKNPFVRKN